jgi:hypothetical protein
VREDERVYVPVFFVLVVAEAMADLCDVELFAEPMSAFDGSEEVEGVLAVFVEFGDVVEPGHVVRVAFAFIRSNLFAVSSLKLEFAFASASFAL